MNELLQTDKLLLIPFNECKNRNYNNLINKYRIKHWSSKYKFLYNECNRKQLFIIISQKNFLKLISKQFGNEFMNSYEYIDWRFSTREKNKCKDHVDIIIPKQLESYYFSSYNMKILSIKNFSSSHIKKCSNQVLSNFMITSMFKLKSED